MGYTFNPLIYSGLDLAGGGGGAPYFMPPVPTEADLPTPATDGELRVVLATDHVYVYNDTGGRWYDTGLNTGTAVGNTPNDVGYDASVEVQGGIERSIIVLQPADATHPGIISTGFQAMGGLKSFPSGINLPSEPAETVAIIDIANNITGSVVTTTELGYLSGVTSPIQTQLDSKIPLAEKAQPNGVATLDAGGKVPVSQLPNSVMEYKGTWDPVTNTPTLVDGSGNSGDVYRVTVAFVGPIAGLTDPSMVDFNIGDYVIYNGSVWQKADTTDAVISVNGQIGAVVLDTDDINEGATNLYFTDQRVKDVVGPADIYETSFSGANNQIAPASVTGLVFAGTVRSFEAMVDVQVAATTPLYEHFKLFGVNKAGTWVLYVQSFGDNSSVDFLISSGQVQYVSGNYTGFTSLQFRFRALTLSN